MLAISFHELNEATKYCHLLTVELPCPERVNKPLLLPEQVVSSDVTIPVNGILNERDPSKHLLDEGDPPLTVAYCAIFKIPGEFVLHNPRIAKGILNSINFPSEPLQPSEFPFNPAKPGLLDVTSIRVVPTVH